MNRQEFNNRVPPRDPLDISLPFEIPESEVELRLIEDADLQNARVTYTGQSLHTTKYPTRIFVNSKYKKRKHLDQLWQGPVVNDEVPISVDNDIIAPSGALLRESVKLFSLPPFTNVVDFQVDPSTNREETSDVKLEKFKSLTGCKDVQPPPVLRHRRIEEGFDEYGNFTVDVTNQDVLKAYAPCSAGRFSAQVGDSSKSVTVPRLREVVRLRGYTHHKVRPVVLYVPSLTRLNAFLSMPYGSSFFYSNNPSELLTALSIGLNIVVIYRHLYLWITRTTPDVHLIIIVERNSYFDTTKIKNRLIILNPLQCHPEYILSTLFVRPSAQITPLSLLSRLRIKFGTPIEGLDVLGGG